MGSHFDEIEIEILDDAESFIPSLYPDLRPVLGHEAHLGRGNALVDTNVGNASFTSSDLDNKKTDDFERPPVSKSTPSAGSRMATLSTPLASYRFLTPACSRAEP